MSLIFVQVNIQAQSPGRVESLLPMAPLAEPGVLELMGFLNDLEKSSQESPSVDKIEDIRQELQQVKGAQRQVLQLDLAFAEQEYAFFLWEQRLQSLNQKYEQWRGLKKGALPRIPRVNSLVRGLKKAEREYSRFLASSKGSIQAQWKLGFLKALYARKEAIQILEKSFKRSRGRIRSKISLTLAELYYASGQKKKSRQFWRSVLAGKNSQSSEDLKSYASYRMSWMLVHENRKRNALQQMVRIVIGRKKSFFRNEVIKDIVAFTGDENAFRLIRRLKSKHGYTSKHREYALSRSAWRLLEKEKFQASFALLENIQRKNKRHVHSVLSQFEIIKKSYQKNQYLTLPRFLVGFEKRLRDKNAEDFSQKNVSLSQLNKDFESWVALVVQDLYKKSVSNQKILKPLSLTLKFFMQKFPRNPKIPFFKFYAAKTYERMNDFHNSVDFYYQTATKGPKQFAVESAEKMVTLQSELIKSILLYPPYFSTKIVRIPVNLSRYIQLGDTYIKMLPRSNRVTTIRFEIAKIMSRTGQLEKARNRYHDVVKGNPSSQQAKVSVGAVLKHLALVQDWRRLVYWSETYLKYARQLGRDVQSQMVQHLTVGMWQIAERYAKQRRYLDSAMAFEAFQRRLPTAEQADLALNKAVLLYLKLGRGPQGMNAAERLFQAYPSSQYRGDLMFRVAEAASGIGLYERAAVYYESFVLTRPQDSRAAVAYYRAASLYGGRGNLDRRAFLLGKMAQTYPSSSLSLNALLEAAKLRLELGQLLAAESLFRAYSSKAQADLDHKIFAQAQVGLIMKKMRGSMVAIQSIEGFLKLKPITVGRSGRQALADYHFNEIIPYVKEFSTLKINYYDYATYQKSLALYLQAMKRIENAYTSSIQIADPQSAVRGWYLMAKLFEESLIPFQEAWDMSGLLPEEVRKIELSKKSVMKDLKAKVLVSYKNAWVMALRYRVFSDERQEAFIRLSTLQPGQYSNVHEAILLPVSESFVISGRK